MEVASELAGRLHANLEQKRRSGKGCESAAARSRACVVKGSGTAPCLQAGRDSMGASSAAGLRAWQAMQQSTCGAAAALGRWRRASGACRLLLRGSSALAPRGRAQEGPLLADGWSRRPAVEVCALCGRCQPLLPPLPAETHQHECRQDSRSVAGFCLSAPSFWRCCVVAGCRARQGAAARRLWGSCSCSRSTEGPASGLGGSGTARSYKARPAGHHVAAGDLINVTGGQGGQASSQGCHGRPDSHVTQPGARRDRRLPVPAGRGLAWLLWDPRIERAASSTLQTR